MMKQYNVRLTKVGSIYSDLKNKPIEGVANSLPTVGHNFSMFTKSPVDVYSGIRFIQTSEVHNVEQIGNEYVFVTRSSTYKLEVLDDIKANSLRTSFDVGVDAKFGAQPMC
jgi:hypothetical protein